ncbi:MAG: SRPBCC family protein [Weeksellaceae bacterium]|nr:SRPBCC family protein [Weeksellaceae bacterium]
MKLESRKVLIQRPINEVFQFISTIQNYEQLMPENAEFSMHESGQGFSVQLKGLPKVGLKQKEIQEPHYILFESPTDNFKYEMRVNATETEDGNTETFIDFDGDFNPMLEMMAKSPLTKFIEQIADNLEKSF